MSTMPRHRVLIEAAKAAALSYADCRIMAVHARATPQDVRDSHDALNGSLDALAQLLNVMLAALNESSEELEYLAKASDSDYARPGDSTVALVADAIAEATKEVQP